MEDFKTADVKSIMSKIMSTLGEDTPANDPRPSEKSPKKTELPTDEKKRTVKPQDFVNNTWRQMMAKQKKVKDACEKRKAEQEEELKRVIVARPEINQASRTMVGQSRPIHDRVSQILEEKEQRMDFVKERLTSERESAESQELTFQPKLVAKAKGRQPQDFYRYTTSWKEHKLVCDELRRLELEQDVNSLSFTPAVDKNSSKMVHRPSNKAPEERLADWKKQSEEGIQYKRDNLPYSFTPAINAKSQRLRKNRSEANVFHRLYFANKQGTSEFEPKATDSLQWLLQGTRES